MSTHNAITDRLITDARRKIAKQERAVATRGRTAMIVGIVALVVSPMSVAGWVLGAVTLGLGTASMRRPESARHARIALVLGLSALAVATFFETFSIAIR